MWNKWHRKVRTAGMYASNFVDMAGSSPNISPTLRNVISAGDLLHASFLESEKRIGHCMTSWILNGVDDAHAQVLTLLSVSAAALGRTIVQKDPNGLDKQKAVSVFNLVREGRLAWDERVLAAYYCRWSELNDTVVIDCREETGQPSKYDVATVKMITCTEECSMLLPAIEPRVPECQETSCPVVGVFQLIQLVRKTQLRASDSDFRITMHLCPQWEIRTLLGRCRKLSPGR